MHLDPERIQRLLDGELPAADELRFREHLTSCSACRRDVDEAERERREVDGLLSRLDHPAPRLDARAVANRALANRALARSRPWHARPLVQAAGFVLACGIVSAAYALPGSPLPRWVAGVVQWIGAHAESRPPAPVKIPEAPAAGIAVDPGRSLLIVFTSARPADRIRLSLTDGADVAVRAPNGAATFTSDAQRLLIDNRGDAATFEIEIPRTAPRIEIRVGERPVFLKEGARITTESAADSAAPYLLRLTPS